MEPEVELLEQEILILNEKLSEKQNLLQELKSAIKAELFKSPVWTLDKDEIARYSRQMIIPDIGVAGQKKLKKSSVLVVGAGGLGCPALDYLARAGIENIGIVDYDCVDVNNLHRQILFTELDLKLPKTLAAKKHLLQLNPSCNIETFNCQISSKNALEIIQKFDIILDCTDNVPTRYLLNDACVLLEKPLVSGSALKLEGQITIYHFRDGPCYRCLFPKPPDPKAVTNCSDGGILGAITGVIGSLQALEAIKVILDFPDVLNQRLLVFDGQQTVFRNIRLRAKNPKCPICSNEPTITQLIDYEEFCNMKMSDKDFSIDILERDDRITVEDYVKLIENCEKNLLIDVRSPIEYEFCHLANSRNIPLDDIIENKFLDEINKDIEENNTKVVIVCRRGNDSQLAVQHLKKYLKSYPKDIIGGLYAWQKVVEPNFPIY